MRTTTAFVLICSLLALPLAAQMPIARDIAGKVEAVSGKTLIIKLESDELLPRVGDPVDISFKLSGGEKVDVGHWKVSKVTGATIQAALARSQGDASPGMDAVIHTVVAPQPKIPPGNGPGNLVSGSKTQAPYRWGCDPRSQTCVWIKFRGRDYETSYSHQINSQNVPVDVYYYLIMANGRPLSYNGKVLWNRFARLPATDYADQSKVVWAHVTRVQEGNTWVEHVDTDAHFEVLASPPDTD